MLDYKSIIKMTESDIKHNCESPLKYSLTKIVFYQVA